MDNGIDFIDVTSSRFDVRLYTSTYYSNVVFPTWTESNDQDDIKWYDGTYLAYQNGKYIYGLTVFTSNHGGQTGLYNVHAYPGTSAGSTGAGIATGAVNVPSRGGGTVIITPPAHICNSENYCNILHTHTSYWGCTCGGTHIQYRHAMCSICGKRSPVTWWKCPISPAGSEVVCQ